MSPHVHLPTVRRYKIFSGFYSLQITKHYARTESPQLSVTGPHPALLGLQLILVAWLLSWINCDARLWRLGVLLHLSGVQCSFIGLVDPVHTFTIKQVKQLFFFFFNTSLFGGFKKGCKKVWNPAAFSMLMQIIASLRHCISWFYCVPWCNKFILSHLSWLIGEERFALCKQNI